uniref:helix-turn-helix transcriptional regulator n=1 Tax=Enterococcus sp. HMSC072H05 TaxID=1715012 RepID=UPI003563C12B
TQEELSELSGVSRVSIGNYERGDREPTVSIAIAIAESLGVTFEELVFAKTENTFKAELGKTYDQDGNEPLYETKPNLLEIKLKDTDSVPEVWYKGEKLGKYPECLVDISYHWNTGGMNDNGANDINIEYYSTPDDKHLDKKIIGHKRDM